MNQKNCWKLARPLAVGLAFLPVVIAVSQPAQALTVTGEISARIVIGNGCQINGLPDPLTNPLSFGELDFGEWIELADPGSPNIDASTSDSAGGGFTIECNDNITYTISVNGGLHHNGTTRRMQNGGTPTQFVNYGVFQDVARTLPWVVGTPVSYPVTGTALAPVSTTHHFYGRVPPQNQSTSGTYTDTLEVSLSW